MGNANEKMGGKGGSSNSLKKLEVQTSRDDLTLTQHDVVIMPVQTKRVMEERDELTLTQHDVVISVPVSNGEQIDVSTTMVGMRRVLTQSDVIEEADKYYAVKDTSNDYTGGLMK